MDKQDKSILRVLQTEGRISNQQLAERVNLSTAPCWRRVNKLEQQDIIDRYVAILNRNNLGLSVMVYIQISLRDHREDTVKEFLDLVNRDKNILECYSSSGEYDYLIKVVAQNVIEFENFLQRRLQKLNSVFSTNTSFILKENKFTTALPVP